MKAFGFRLVLLASGTVSCVAACERSLSATSHGIGMDAGADAVSSDATLTDRSITEPIIVIDSWCGDGFLDLGRGEACDDGNRRAGDGCGPLCQIEPDEFRCGDGWASARELCDDGNAVGGDGCSATCSGIEAGWRCPLPGVACAPQCGDGRMVGDETCDDGNTVGGDGCSATCEVEGGCTCGPGVCDCVPCVDGWTAGGASCDVPRCGDGVIGGAEVCDDGAFNGVGDRYPGCTNACEVLWFCGDGVVVGPEQCDRGTANGGAYGEGNCTPACLPAPYCGDGVVDSAHGEQCDLGSNNGPDPSHCRGNCRIILI